MRSILHSEFDRQCRQWCSHQTYFSRKMLLLCPKAQMLVVSGHRNSTRETLKTYAKNQGTVAIWPHGIASLAGKATCSQSFEPNKFESRNGSKMAASSNSFEQSGGFEKPQSLRHSTWHRPLLAMAMPSSYWPHFLNVYNGSLTCRPISEKSIFLKPLHRFELSQQTPASYLSANFCTKSSSCSFGSRFWHAFHYVPKK